MEKLAESIDDLVLPVGHSISGERQDKTTYWLGRLSDGTICGIVANPYDDQNSVDYFPIPGEPTPETPSERKELTVMNLQVLMLRATLQSQYSEILETV